MVEGSHVYKNIVGQVVGKNQHGFIVKTADTVIEVIDYSYDGKIRIGDRLINYAQENKG
jgi:methionyl-tRNA formyltransferase